ncbi:MAG: hypothetical protein KZQ94_16165 [Candidatus Thiodiazotropha sp. (ex Troendleina suluensis)]|nr:hypothetical protein [Candidatus Thiodiazotropha sp. (ex Troendleina suluensis)]
MNKSLILLLAIASLSGCVEKEEYELKKYYKDATSPAAKLMGGTYAGVVETFNSIDACMEMKKQIEQDDRDIGYTNARFVCDKK